MRVAEAHLDVAFGDWRGSYESPMLSFMYSENSYSRFICANPSSAKICWPDDSVFDLADLLCIISILIK